MYKKRESLLQVSISKGESIGIVDGGKQSVFRRNNLPIHHFVVERHHGEVQIGILAGELLQGGVDGDSVMMIGEL